MKAELDLVENTQIWPGKPPINKSIHDVGVACTQERGIRVIFINLDSMRIQEFPHRLVPQTRHIRGVPLVQSTPKGKWDSKFNPKRLRSVTEESACLRAGNRGLKESLDVPESLGIVRVMPTEALKHAGGKKRDPGGVPSDSDMLKRATKGRGEDMVPF